MDEAVEKFDDLFYSGISPYDLISEISKDIVSEIPDEDLLGIVERNSDLINIPESKYQYDYSSLELVEHNLQNYLEDMLWKHYQDRIAA